MPHLPIPHPAPAHLAALLAALLMTYLGCHPILSFARRGWKIKRDDILSSFSTEAKRAYLLRFLRQQSAHPDGDFQRMYVYRYGRYRLWTPTLLLILVLLPLTFLLAETAMVRLVLVHDGLWRLVAQRAARAGFVTLPREAAAAAAGAYLWVVYALIMGAAQYNLPPGNILSAALRMVVAVPLGYAVGIVAPAGPAPFVAFAIGAFPIETVQLLLQRLANQRLGLEIGGSEQDDARVALLDGVDRPTADRLQTAAITTIPQLAHCDPVQLSMRTNLDFDYILDIVGQALAWIYLGKHLDELRPVGLRGALEMRNLVFDLRSQDPARRDAAQRAFAAAAAASGVAADGLANAFDEIALDPYTEFLSKTWTQSTRPAPVRQPDPERAIRERAYFLWEAAGRPENLAEHFWQLARRPQPQPPRPPGQPHEP